MSSAAIPEQLSDTAGAWDVGALGRKMSSDPCTCVLCNVHHVVQIKLHLTFTRPPQHLSLTPQVELLQHQHVTCI